MALRSPTAEQAEVILSNSDRLCVFACAGSGKTFTLVQRIVRLVKEGTLPNKIAAITFTNLAADHLRRELVRELGDHAAATQIFAGTIHSFCHHLIQTCTADLLHETLVLSDGQQFVLLSGRWDEWSIQDVAPDMAKTELIERLITTFAIIKMENIDSETLAARHPEVARLYNLYREECRKEGWVDFADLLVTARDALNDDAVFRARVFDSYSHLLVDEYQDVDPVQAAIVERLAKGVSVLVVGDDDQCIYQFRGTDVRNILEFSACAETEKRLLSENRRCPENVVALAQDIATRIARREPKSMRALYGQGLVRLKEFETAQEEAEFVADEVLGLLSQGLVEDFGDIAVLMRSVASYGSGYVDALKARGIPVAVRGGRDLFRGIEVSAVRACLEWMIDERSAEESITMLEAPAQLELGQSVDPDSMRNWLDGQTFRRLLAVRHRYESRKFDSMVELLFSVMDALGLVRADASPLLLYNLAQLSAVVTEYETIERSPRLSRLCGFLSAYASRSYDECVPEEHMRKAVNVLTVHQAKGLEYRFVFIPMLVEKRFPLEGESSRWLIDDDLFDAARYYAGADSERRLFYVACTRASHGLTLSCAKDVGLKYKKRPSAFFYEAMSASLPGSNAVPSLRSSGEDVAPFLSTSYSALEYYLTCPYRYHLLREVGFRSPPNPFFRFGQVVHGVLGHVTRNHVETGHLFPWSEVESMYDDLFGRLMGGGGLPSYVIQTTRRRGLNAVKHFYDNRRDWIVSAVDVERDFDFADDRCIVRGRLDLLCAAPDGSRLIVDIKTGRPHDYLRPDFQMQFYSMTARQQLGVPVTAALLYYVEQATAVEYHVDQSFLDQGKSTLDSVVSGILAAQMDPSPGAMCGRCEMRQLCEFKGQGRR